MRIKDDERQLIEAHGRHGQITSEDLEALDITCDRGRLIARRHRLKLIDTPDRSVPQPAETFTLYAPAEAVTDFEDDDESTEETEINDGDIRGPDEANMED